MNRIVKENFITLNRGDSFEMPIFVNCGTEMRPERYYLQEGDKLYFGLMEPNKLWEQSIIRKSYNNESSVTPYGDIIVRISPEETEYLVPGTYYYSVKLLLASGDVTTIIPKTLFYII